MLIPRVIVRTARIEQQNIMHATKVLATLLRVIMGGLALPNNFVDEFVFAENLIEYNLDCSRLYLYLLGLALQKFVVTRGSGLHIPKKCQLNRSSS